MHKCCVRRAACGCLQQYSFTRSIPSSTLPWNYTCKSKMFRATGCTGSIHRQAQCSSASQTQSPVIPREYQGASQEAYLAGFKNGYAAGVQVTVNVSLDSGKNLKAVEYSAGVQQDSLLRSLLKGLVWRVFSTALTVSIILAVFHDTVQVEQALQIGGLEFVLKLLVYFAHERLWVQIGDSIS